MDQRIILATARIHVRPLRPDDAESLFAATSDPEVMRCWDWPAHETPATTAAMVAAQLEEVAAQTALYWAICAGPESPAIGTCDLSEIDLHHRRAEIGFMLARSHWGRGYAFEAAQAVVEYAFGTAGLHRLAARTHAGNDRSAKLLERLGFRLEGTLRGHVLRDGARRDCWLFGLLAE
ncbi:MAG: GNAT family N-acetyltransferase [Candidatus Binatales bacterium]